VSDTATGGPAEQAPRDDAAASDGAGPPLQRPAGEPAGSAERAVAAERGGLPIAPSVLSPRPYVRSASVARAGEGAAAGGAGDGAATAGGPARRRAGAGRDPAGEGALRASFADLAAAAEDAPHAGGVPIGDPPAGGPQTGGFQIGGSQAGGFQAGGPRVGDLDNGGLQAGDTAAGELAAYGQGRRGLEHRDPLIDRDDAPLLLRSVIELREVWLPLLAAAGVRSVTLLGTEHGRTTALLVELLRAGGGGRLLVVDPEPGRVPASGRGLDIEVVREHGATGLAGHTPTDAYLIDGDANYATAAGVLAAADDAVYEFGRATFPLVVIHDVGWPTGRRDRYASPDRLTDADRQPFTWDGGVTLDRTDTIPGRALRGEGAYAWAIEEGGPRNGVRTAVEEFVAGYPELMFFTVAPVFGLGVVVDRRAPYATRIAELLAPWVSNPLLARLERNRLDLYLRVVAQRDDAMAAAQSHHHELARLDAERLRLVAIDIEKSDRIAELERALAAERAATAAALHTRLEEPRLVAAARSADSRLRARFRRGPSKLEQARAQFAAEEQRRREELAALGESGGRLALPPGGATGLGGASGLGAAASGFPLALAAGPSAKGLPSDGPSSNGSFGTGAFLNGAGLAGPSANGATDGRYDSAPHSGGAQEAAERLRGRHRLHRAGGEPDVVAGGRDGQTPRLWTPTRTSAAPARRTRRGAGTEANGSRNGAFSAAPATRAVPRGGGASDAFAPFEPTNSSSAYPNAYPDRVVGQNPAPSPDPVPNQSPAPPGAVLLTPPAPPPSAGPDGLAVTPIQSGQPIPAGQPIPPGSAVQPGPPADPATGGQPALFDRSGVPRRRRMASALNPDRHEPRHRASTRNQNPNQP